MRPLARPDGHDAPGQIDEAVPVVATMSSWLWKALLEPLREVLIHAEGVGARRRSMVRIMTMRMKAAVMRHRRSTSRARRRWRLIDPMMRSSKSVSRRA